MTQSPPHVTLNGSRLVRFLSDLAVTDVTLTHKNFAQRLGQLIGFSDSFTLATRYDELKSIKFDQSSIPADLQYDSVSKEILQVRKSIVQSIIKSFAPNNGSSPVRNKFPVGTADTLVPQSTAYEPYLRFYTAKQRDIDLKIQTLQTSVRDSVSGISPELAQLAALDSALTDMLVIHQRKVFAVIPGLLRKRFEHLLHEYRGLEQQRDHSKQHGNKQSDDNSTLSAHSQTLLENFNRQFCTETQGLLLAELELRLQPVIGLIEALNQHEKDNEEVDKNHD